MPLAARCRKPHWLAGAPKLQQSFCSRLVCPSLTGSLGFPRGPRPMRHLTRRARRPHPLRMPGEVPKPHHRTSEVAPISTRCVRRGTPPRSAAQFLRLKIASTSNGSGWSKRSITFGRPLQGRSSSQMRCPDWAESDPSQSQGAVIRPLTSTNRVRSSAMLFQATPCSLSSIAGAASNDSNVIHRPRRAVCKQAPMQQRQRARRSSMNHPYRSAHCG